MEYEKIFLVEPLLFDVLFWKTNRTMPKVTMGRFVTDNIWIYSKESYDTLKPYFNIYDVVVYDYRWNESPNIFLYRMTKMNELLVCYE